MRSKGAAAALLCAGVLTASCSSPGRPTAGVLLRSPGAGYHLNDASGPLTKHALAYATALPRDTMAAYLDANPFRSASERVWTSRDDGFVTDVLVDTGEPAAAARLVGLAGSALPGPATQSFAPGVAGGRGFVQTSDVHGQTMFCVMAFFSIDVRAFVVTRCTPYPQDTTTVVRLSKDQFTRASRIR